MLEILKNLRNREYKFLHLVKDFFLTKVLDAIVNTSLKEQGQRFSKERKRNKAYLINIKTTNLKEEGIVTDYGI
jgi:hypothetical protein